MGQGSTFKRRLRDASVVDLLFYLMLLVCVVFQTWGYSFTDRAYMGSVVLMGILVVAKIASARYSASELIICAMLIGSGLFFAVRAHRYTLLLTAVLLIAAKGIDIDELLEKYLVIKTFALVALFLLAAVGVFDVTTVQHYRMNTGVFETRTFINGAQANSIHLGLFTVLVLWFYRKYGRITLAHLIACIVLDFVLYLGVTMSMAGLIMTAFGTALMYLCSRFKGVERVVVGLSPAIPFLFLAVALFAGFAYGSNGFLDALNRVSTGRIAYDHYWLTTYGISLFGADYSQLITEGNFDDSFIFVPVIYGAVFAAMLYGAVTALFLKMKRDQVARGTLLMVLFLIYSFAESMYPSAVVNPSLFLLGWLFFGGMPKKAAESGDSVQTVSIPSAQHAFTRSYQ